MAAPVGEARRREASRPSWGLVVCAKGLGILCGVGASLSEGCAGLGRPTECPPWQGLGASDGGAPVTVVSAPRVRFRP